MWLPSIFGPIRRLLTNPRYVTMRLLGRFHFVREAVRKRGALLPPESGLEQSLFPSLEIDGAVANLEQDGLSQGIQLPQQALADILKLASSAPCFANGRDDLGFYMAERERAQAARPDVKFVTAHFFNVAAGCEAIRRLEKDPKLLAIAARYVGTRPVHMATTMWWSFAGQFGRAEQHESAQLFHFDVDDYKFVKFFFYLTDVDRENGPHVCVVGSHREKKLIHQFHQRRFEDAEIIESYGADRVVAICGPAGFGFAEDTVCFHKGLPPRTADRLLLQIEFGRTDFGVYHNARRPSDLRMIL